MKYTNTTNTTNTTNKTMIIEDENISMEVFVTAIGEIKMEVEVRYRDESLDGSKILSKEELNKMINDLITIRDEI